MHLCTTGNWRRDDHIRPIILHTNILSVFADKWHSTCFSMAMNIALPTWRGRISPVLDVAGNFLLVEARDAGEAVRTESRLDAGSLAQKVAQLSSLGVEVLICAALSREMETFLAAAGIQVIPHICGPTEEVLRAYLDGQFTGETFLMPGCCGHRRRHGHRAQEDQMGTQLPGQRALYTPANDGTAPQGQGTGSGRGRATCGSGGGQRTRGTRHGSRANMHDSCPGPDREEESRKSPNDPQ
jgi:predicted Fe-Mo cluster-binding NifX family protein